MPVRRRFAFVAASILALTGVALAVPTAANAATIPVADEAQLIAAAATAVSGDTISVTASIALTATVTFPAGVTIQGSGVETISRANNLAYRLFDFAPTAASQDYIVRDLIFDGTTGTGSAVRLVDGAQDVSDATFDGVQIHDFTAPTGAAILVERMTAGFRVEDSTFERNSAAAGNGGAIAGTFFNSNLDIVNSTFTDNTATGSGGGAYLDGDNAFVLTVDGAGFDGNSANGGFGGGFWVDGITTAGITDSTFSQNHADDSGGAAWITTSFGIVVEDTTFSENITDIDDGGALWLSAGQAVRIDRSTFQQNGSAGNGGGVYTSSLGAFSMNGTTFDGNDAEINGGGVRVNASGLMTLQNLTFTGNSALRGGGISALTMGGVSGSVFANNTVTSGGGAIHVNAQTTDFSMGRNSLTGNSTTGNGTDGGAVLVDSVTDGAIRFYNSTFSGNSAGPAPGALGVSVAIIAVQGDPFMQFQESTFDEPLGTGPVFYVGGVPNGATFSLSRATVLGASGALTLPGPIAGTAEIENSIVDGDTNDTGVASVVSTPIPTSYSLIDEAITASYIDQGGNQFGIPDADLGPLQNNGGPTFTRLPNPGSPAINTGDPSPGLISTTDQRLAGFDRIRGGRLDIGAVEVQFALLATSGSDSAWPTLFLGLFGVFAGIALVGADRRWAARLGS